MKEIILVRHAKSDWGNEGLSDIDRFLNDRGYSDAYSMSEWFHKHHEKPELILSSTATRALSTAMIFIRSMNFDLSSFGLEPSIYEAKAEKLLEIIRAQNEKINSLMLFGHNPGFTNLCNQCAVEFYIDNLPTCGIVSMNFDVKSWKLIKEKTAKINYSAFPKDYRNKN